MFKGYPQGSALEEPRVNLDLVQMKFQTLSSPCKGVAFPGLWERVHVFCMWEGHKSLGLESEPEYLVLKDPTPALSVLMWSSLH